ncbi:MAG TPA: hypothetical protein VGW39_01475 [Chthoniobacterales bacterium]|nr:hypothetical protein [Chthoniobacterales bacterium]
MRKINLKRSFLLLVLGLPLPMAVAVVEDLPKPFTFARYQPMMDRSPFAVATAVAAPVAAPNFAKDLYVANAARAKEGDLVTVASSTDKTFKKYLTTAAPVDGYSITNIEWSEKIGATKVTIAKDGQTATIGFNEALLQGPAGQNPMSAQNPVAAQPLVPPPQNPVAAQSLAQDKNAAGQLPVPPGVQAPSNPKAMPVPMLPTPPPRVRGIIPRNPASAPATQPQLQQKQQQQPQSQPQQKPNS